MNYSDFHLYTVAKGQRFVDAALRCANSFVEKNPGLKFTIFVIGKPYNIYSAYTSQIGLDANHPNITVFFKDCPEYFTPAMLKKKPCADILFFKYADAPFMLEGDEKYIGQVDADCLCMCKLPFEYFIEDLEAGKFCAASDPKVEVNKREIDEELDLEWKLYFNSGVCFWKRSLTKWFLKDYKEFVSANIKVFSKLSYADQTWMNIYMNLQHRTRLSEIGWYWNFRGTVRHPRAYIWHAGGRDSEGIEVLKKEFESWK